MSDMNNLQKALLLVEEEEAQKYNDIFESPEPHTFSKKYLRRRKDIIDIGSERTREQDGKQYKRIYRISFRTILVAALVMIMATITVIAITKPHIYYVIKEKLDSWVITFIQEDEDAVEVVFTPQKPEIPKGFEVVTEESSNTMYYLEIDNNNGESLSFEQRLPGGTSVGIDSERSENEIKTINGEDVIFSKEGNVITAVCDDGDYVYIIVGNTNENIILHMIEEIVKK